jgi:hypothetical protein
METPNWVPFASFLFYGFAIEKQNIGGGSSNEHYYQFWFQLAPWLQRKRFKSIRMTLEVLTIPYIGK